MSHPETQVTAENAAKSEKKPVKPTAHFAGMHAQITEALNIAEFGVPTQAQPFAQRGVLIQTSRNLLTLSTFDFWTAVSVTVPVGAPVGKGCSLLDFVELKKVLAAMVAGETKTVAARTPVSLAGDLLATEHITVPITTLDIHEFTRPPEAVPAMATMDAQRFLTQLNRVLPAAGRDETLPVLTGVQMTLEGQTLTLAATDRYRFAVAEVPVTATVQPLVKSLSSLIPASVLTPLAKRLKSYEGPVGIGIIEDGKDVVARATLSMGDTTITMRPLEGSLPKHNSLFPTERDTSVRVDRATAVRAAKKCQALIKAKGETNVPVSFAWDADGTLTLAPRVGTAEDQVRTKGMTIPSTITHGNTATLKGNLLALNPAFLLDALGTFTSDTFTLHIREMKDGQTSKPVPLEGVAPDGASKMGNVPLTGAFRQGLCATAHEARRAPPAEVRRAPAEGNVPGSGFHAPRPGLVTPCLSRLAHMASANAAGLPDRQQRIRLRTRMKHGKVIITVVALVVIFALSVVMIVVGQPVAAITALIPSVALGVQHIVHATTSTPASPPLRGDEREREWPG
ncbi:DNA polymerase III subunit beta [Streptomyces sp. NPDC000229]|uniref:DNA polymerase III subunit beta n=1 Tax=Streptomyces sp. NPDC000229 TaxID=3154247 RepID=UPI00332A87BE